jgi:hypothetical protein
MQHPIATTQPILAAAEPGSGFAGLDDPANDPAEMAALLAVAAHLGAKPRPGSRSDIPAGATYLAQLAVHDLDFHDRDAPGPEPRLDLSLIYGDGPRHDAPFYQVPAGPGQPRHLLRIGRTRPTEASPAWGAARDLPRTGCPHLDAHGVETRTDVLIPNTFSDSNLMLGQMQTLWVLLHNAVAEAVVASAGPAEAFAIARRVTLHVYRAVILHDVLGSWLHPDLRARYIRDTPDRLSTAPLGGMPRAFMAGVARLGHGLVREIYSLNDQRPVVGLRDAIRHTSTGRPHEMPLTEDWLLDFGRFFAVGGSKPQFARALGPHIPRPFRLGGGVGLDGPNPTDGLVLRDLLACCRGDMPAVRSLVDRIESASPGLLEGSFAQDENTWREVLPGWLADAGLEGARRDRLAADPPLVLFLMLEAEAETRGRSLGRLGSVIMGETFAAALSEPAMRTDLDLARATVFPKGVPETAAELIIGLQAHYRFAEGARLHPVEDDAAAPSRRKEFPMLDTTPRHPAPEGLVEVADYVEFGRLVTEWTLGETERPCDIRELRNQLDGIAVVPDSFKEVLFVESASDTLVIRLPERELLAQTREALEAPQVTEGYMLPKFYDDYYHKGFGPVMSPLEMFLARVGDYTIAQCK